MSEKLANIETTIRCNLDCPMCTQRQLRRGTPPKDMVLSVFKRIVDEHKDINHISFIGGEPFLNKDFFAMMKFLDKRGITYEITTNGTLISKDVILGLKKCKGLEEINFSIDGLRTYHNKVRGRGVFEKCMEALRLIKDVFPTTVCSVARKANLKQLPLLSVLLAKMGLKTHKIIYPVSISIKSRQQSRKLLLGLTMQGPVVEDIPAYHEMLELFRILQGLERRLGISVEFEPAVMRKKPQLFFREGVPASFHCRQVRQYRFDSCGRRIVCEFIRNEFGPQLKEYLSRKLLPMCKWCCKLE